MNMELDENTIDNIKEEIRERLATGESAESVLMDLKERGISSLDFLPGMVKEEDVIYAEIKANRKRKWKKTASILFILAVIGWIILWLIRHT